MRHTRQPQTVSPIDVSTPVGRSIGLLAVPGLPELVQKRPAVVSGGYVITPGAAGKAALGPATPSPGYVGYDLGAALPVNGDFTLAFLVSAAQVNGGQETHVIENTGPLGLTVLRLGSTSVEVVLDGGSSGTVLRDFTRPSLIVARRVGSTADLRVNNVLVATWATAARTGTITGLTLGRSRAGNQNSGNQTATFLAAIATRAWTAAEVTRFSADPWQVIRFQNRRLATPPARFALTGRACTGGTTSSIAAAVMHHGAVGAGATGSTVCTRSGIVSRHRPGATACAGEASSAPAPTAQHHGAVGAGSAGLAAVAQGVQEQRHRAGGAGGAGAAFTPAGALAAVRAVLVGQGSTGAVTSPGRAIVRRLPPFSIGGYSAPLGRMWRAPATERFWRIDMECGATAGGRPIFSKALADIADYGVDLIDACELQMEGGTDLPVSVTMSAVVGVTLAPGRPVPAVAGARYLVAWFAGGDPGGQNYATFHVFTAAGREFDKTIYFDIGVR
jgi:hypothetical protein